MNSCLVKMVAYTLHGTQVFRKADSLIDLVRDAVKADVKKTSNTLISWMPYNILQMM